MTEKKSNNEIEGIGGWLILPIIGLFATIVIQLADLSESLSYYSFQDVIPFVLINLVLIALCTVALFFIFTKSKQAPKYAIATLVINGALAVLLGLYAGLIGTVIWVLYFLKSERVKNTFVN